MGSSRPGTSKTPGSKGSGSGSGHGSTGAGSAKTSTKKIAGKTASTGGTGTSPAVAAAAPAAKKFRPPRASLTGRAIALAVVLLILVISYASSLRVYFAQAHEIAATRAEITQRQQAIDQLQAERARWDDPEYVRAQARERLGWVVPGEIGYRVVDANGNPVGGGEQIEAGSTGTAGPDKAAWWTKLRDSVASADNPAPAPKSTAPPTVTVDSQPGG